MHFIHGTSSMYFQGTHSQLCMYHALLDPKEYILWCRSCVSLWVYGYQGAHLRVMHATSGTSTPSMSASVQISHMSISAVWPPIINHIYTVSEEILQVHKHPHRSPLLHLWKLRKMEQAGLTVAKQAISQVLRWAIGASVNVEESWCEAAGGRQHGLLLCVNELRLNIWVYNLVICT